MRLWSPDGLNLTGFISPPQIFVHHVLSLSLSDQVPEEIRRLYKRAIATLSYGIYYMPIMSLADDALNLLMEVALFRFCQNNGWNKSEKRTKLFTLCKFCRENNLLTEKALTYWELIRLVRNDSAHRKEDKSLYPNWVLNNAITTKEIVDDLFVYGPPDFTRVYLNTNRTDNTIHQMSKNHFTPQAL